VFSNRHFRLKLGGALVVIALMGVYAAREGDAINPALWRCLAEPERWRDASLWLPYATVLSVRDGEFEIRSDEVEVLVKGRAPAKAGAPVTLTAIFRADGPHLELVRSRPLPPRFRLRWLVEAVSVAVVLGVLANFARHFAFRPKVLQAERAP
jgi:hypothetical protein